MMTTEDRAHYFLILIGLISLTYCGAVCLMIYMNRI